MSIEVLFLICGVISFAATELMKPLTRLMFSSRDARVFVVRLIACIVGAIAGYSLQAAIVSLWVGFAAGVLNASVIGYLKLRLNIDSVSADTPQQKKDE